jgi:type II secretory pathway pseudopilin PulG
VITRLRTLRLAGGFTLVETLAALVVFSIVTLGVIPLLISSLRGADLSRKLTVGKNVAVEAMERARGLPYYVSFGSQNSKVDVLDMYFPAAASLSGDQTYATAGTTDGISGPRFITTCSVGSANPACPRTMPADYTLRFVARFVKPVTSAETYGPETPGAGYAWNSTTGTDLPPTQLLELNIRTEWVLRGRTRGYSLRSLVGDRKFGDVSITGFGKVDHGVQVLTSYVDSVGRASDLILLTGLSESRVEKRTVSTSDQTDRAGQLRLVESATGADVAADLATADGATSVHHAPPDDSPAGDSNPARTLLHPNIPDPLDLDELFPVAGIDATTTQSLDLGVLDELPFAVGGYRHEATDGRRIVWANNQIDPTTPQQLNVNNKMFSLRTRYGQPLEGFTEAITEHESDPSRRVETFASVVFNDMRLLPTTNNVVTDTTFGRAVVAVDEFSAETHCTATGSGPSSGATADWSAALYYWSDVDPTDDLPVGQYELIILDGNAGFDPLQAVKSANPLVYDGPTPAEDVFLFQAAGINGYLNDWSVLTAPQTSVSPDARVASASIDGAINITTAPTNPAIPTSAITVSMGKLGCQAADSR